MKQYLTFYEWYILIASILIYYFSLKKDGYDPLNCFHYSSFVTTYNLKTWSKWTLWFCFSSRNNLQFQLVVNRALRHHPLGGYVWILLPEALLRVLAPPSVCLSASQDSPLKHKPVLWRFSLPNLKCMSHVSFFICTFWVESYQSYICVI